MSPLATTTATRRTLDVLLRQLDYWLNADKRPPLDSVALWRTAVLGLLYENEAQQPQQPPQPPQSERRDSAHPPADLVITRSRSEIRAFPKNLRRARVAAGLSQQQLALGLGGKKTSQATISQWEQGKRALPSVQLLARLAAVLNCPPASLLLESRAPSTPTKPSRRRRSTRTKWSGWRPGLLARLAALPPMLTLTHMATVWDTTANTLRRRISRGTMSPMPSSRNPCLWKKSDVEVWIRSATSVNPYLPQRSIRTPREQEPAASTASAVRVPVEGTVDQPHAVAEEHLESSLQVDQLETETITR